MSPHLSAVRPLTLVTNALNVPLTLGPAADAQVILLGGMLSREASSSVGPLTEQTLADLTIKNSFSEPKRST